MNEIKFRQAIFSHGKFSNWHYWGFINSCFIAPETGLSSVKQALENSKQYIGLKDKNGKEIYEGDIVRFGGGGTFTVCWRDYLCAFELINNDKQIVLTVDTAQDVEVIDNVYKNLELVEK